MKKTICFGMLILGLCACTTTDDPARIRVQTDRYRVEYDSRPPTHGESYHFCPPGQAKKGNC